MKKTYTKKQITEAIAYWSKQLKMMNESEDQTLNEMAVRKLDDVISNPKTIEHNWNNVIDILTDNELIEYFDCKSALQDFFRYNQVVKPSRYDDFGEPSVLWRLFGDDGSEFITWLEQKRNFKYSEKLKYPYISCGWTDGDLAINCMTHFSHDTFTEYETNDIDKFKTIAAEFMSDMGYTDAKYVIGIMPLGGSNSEMAKQLAEILKNKNSEVYKVLSQYLFSDRDDEFDFDDEILSQADEVYQEQYMSSVAAGGSDPYGDAEYAREEFLSKHGRHRR